MRTLLAGALTAGAVCAALLSSPAPAHAGPRACSSLPNPVYLEVGDTQQPLMKALGRRLRDNAAHPISLVYVTSGSCTNIDHIYNDVTINVNMLYIPSTAEDPAWTTAMNALPCTVDGPLLSDIANSALFNHACTSEPPPADVGLFQGPVQAYVMAVPEASTQTAITAEEAYFVFGFGTAGMISPWNDENLMFIRTLTKSTLLAWAYNLGVLPPDKWKGQRYDGSQMVVNALLGATDDEKAIGLLGGEVYDRYRDELDALAFRAYGQRYAYYPDSTSTSFDKKNVRDGHYTVWSPTIWMTRVNGAGVPLSANAAYVIDLILGKAVTPAPGFSPVEVVAEVGLVPDCAMGVTRDAEGGNLSIYEPEEPCVCTYEDLVDETSCETCTDTCASGVCRNGFCEER